MHNALLILFDILFIDIWLIVFFFAWKTRIFENVQIRIVFNNKKKKKNNAREILNNFEIWNARIDLDQIFKNMISRVEKSIFEQLEMLRNFENSLWSRLLNIEIEIEIFLTIFSWSCLTSVCNIRNNWKSNIHVSYDTFENLIRSETRVFRVLEIFFLVLTCFIYFRIVFWNYL